MNYSLFTCDVSFKLNKSQTDWIWLNLCEKEKNRQSSRKLLPLPLSSVSCHGPWRCFFEAWKQQSGKLNKLAYTVIKTLDTCHHDPDEEEGVTEENQENWNLTHKEVNFIFLNKRTILD